MKELGGEGDEGLENRIEPVVVHELMENREGGGRRQR